MPELDAVFARVARESDGIQDLGDLCQALPGGAWWITPASLEALEPGRMQGHGGAEEISR
jgi:hypothetical protein